MGRFLDTFRMVMKRAADHVYNAVVAMMVAVVATLGIWRTVDAGLLLDIGVISIWFLAVAGVLGLLFYRTRLTVVRYSAQQKWQPVVGTGDQLSTLLDMAIQTSDSLVQFVADRSAKQVPSPQPYEEMSDRVRQRKSEAWQNWYRETQAEYTRRFSADAHALRDALADYGYEDRRLNAALGSVMLGLHEMEAVAVGLRSLAFRVPAHRTSIASGQSTAGSA